MDRGYQPHLSRWLSNSNRPVSVLVLRLIAVSLPLLGAAALLNVCLMGPVSLGTLRPVWASTFLAFLVAVAAWWMGYWWLLRRLSVLTSSKGNQFALPLALLSLTLLPDLAVILSGRLPYTLVFDEEMYRGFRYGAGAIMGVTVLAQELLLLGAARGRGVTALARDAHRIFAGYASALVRGARAVKYRSWALLILVVILVLGTKLRVDAIDVYHGGDMDVILSITYNILAWPPVTYYRNYMAQTWVYNHLPFYPITLAPLYWLFENVLNLPTVWAAKLLVGVADGVIAVLLYRQAAGRWKRAWGLLLAGIWVLAPWVVGGDDHPIAMATAFVLLALTVVQRSWLAGLLLALGMATRNEVAFLALPMALHILSARGLRPATAFVLVFGTTLALVTVPFVLYDPGAMDYALRRQLQRDASDLRSMLSALLIPRLSAGAGVFLQQNPSLLAIGVNAFISLLALRDRRMDRLALIVFLGYLLTLPLVYERYFLPTYAMGLFYAARYANPLVGVMVLVMVWPGTGYGTYALLALLGVLAFSALFRQRGKPAETPEPGLL